MKRIIAALLCLALLAASPLAWAEDPSQIDIAALMARQVSSNCVLRAQLTAELSETAPQGMAEDTWQTLRAMAADSALEGAYIFSRAGQTLGNSQLSLYWKRGGDTLSTLRLSGRGGLWLLTGDATEGKLWTLPRQTDRLLRDRYLTLSGWGESLLAALGTLEAGLNAPQAGQWPALYRLLTQMASEDENWKASFEEALKPYAAQVSAWMQERTRVYLYRDTDGNLTTGSEMRADRDALADEALALLRMFYGDRVMLALLRPLATRLEAESYLEPGMQILFESVLHAMELPGDFVLERRGGGEDGAERVTASFPLAEGSTVSWTQAGKIDVVRLESADLTAEISLQGALESGLTGSFSLKSGETERSGQYQLTASQQPVYEDEDSTGRARRQQGAASLILMPDAGQDFPAQSLTAEVSARSGLQTDQSAHWNLTLDWQELGGGAWARLTLKTRTGAPIQQTEPEGERLDLAALPAEERLALLLRAAALLLPGAD